ncbi:PaaX family transcriptional regulator C-terminal domain-containing protein [Phaeobacter sp.]|uniref:PaaX family transcriptional regulator C-terminal domain-containing protein n=1 Tax=Phaeobacter sp. TaxID=1902409 RepID=UPI0025F1A4D3|nr:PaaX family transcriptional regulator C-terminal domain-containing protein [Phaeobacter sp.]
MTDLNIPWFDSAIAKLSDPQNQRVWSIIVSLFGDMAQQNGDCINGQTLTQIITPMGIKPEAIRVALHRLRKDGWIDSHKSGRASVHVLTDLGRRQSAEVTPRIYAAAAVPAQAWHLVIAEDGQSTALEPLLEQSTYFSVNRSTALGLCAPPRGGRDLLVVQDPEMRVPGWFQDRLFPADLCQACATLEQVLAAVLGMDLRHAADGMAHREAGQSALPPLTELQIVTLRTLVVHRWRRVVLRHPDLPASFHPKAWRGEPCRQLVAELLSHLPRPQLTASGDLQQAND